MPDLPPIRHDLLPKAPEAKALRALRAPVAPVGVCRGLMAWSALALGDLSLRYPSL